MNSYLLKIYYRCNNYEREYNTQEFLLQATSKTIDKIVNNEIKQFNELNKYKVEQVSIFQHKKSYSLKEM